MPRYLPISLILFLFSMASLASELPSEPESSDKVESVALAGIKDPELEPYPYMLAGLDRFEAMHHLAPEAPELRFLLRPKHAAESMAGLTLRIQSDTRSIEVAIAPDGSFVLPRDQVANDNDAELVLNRTRGHFSAKPEVRSANIPANMRRLGDVRLECQVAIAIAKNHLNFVIRAAANVAMAGSDWCQSSRIHYGVSAPMPSDSITLVSGNRRSVMQTGRQQKEFKLPLADRSWPDDTLVEFQPSAPLSLADFTREPLYLGGTMNKWGQSLPLKQTDASTFSVATVLPQGLSKFKIATKDFHMVDLGIADSKANQIKGNFTVNDGKALAWGGRNVWFEAPKAGTYLFTLTVNDPQAPELAITTLE